MLRSQLTLSHPSDHNLHHSLAHHSQPVPGKERRLSKSFLQEYSAELATLFDKSIGRTN